MTPVLGVGAALHADCMTAPSQNGLPHRHARSLCGRAGRDKSRARRPARDFLQPVPECIFESNARLVASDHDRSLGQAIRLIAARATFHHCNSRKQFEQWPYQSKALSVHVEGYDRDLAGEGKPQGAQGSSVNLGLPRSNLMHDAFSAAA